MVTVIVIFQAKAGCGDKLSAWLLAKHPELGAHPGFRSISIHRDVRDPDRIVEIERWARTADHERMVEAVDAQGGWDALGELVAAEPQTLYLEQIG
jgi:quinol monooxygenase YgiN